MAEAMIPLLFCEKSISRAVLNDKRTPNDLDIAPSFIIDS